MLMEFQNVLHGSVFKYFVNFGKIEKKRERKKEKMNF